MWWAAGFAAGVVVPDFSNIWLSASSTVLLLLEFACSEASFPFVFYKNIVFSDVF